MKDAHLAEQEHSDARAFPLRDLGPESLEEGLDVGPAYRPAHRSPEDQVERDAVPLAQHAGMIPESGTANKR